MPKEIKKVQKKNTKRPTMLGMTMLEVAHEMAQGLYEVGGIDEITMREFDVLCLPPVKELSSNQIKKIRLREKVSQPVFARFLNISPSIVKQWEQGTKKPSGGLLRLLNIVADKGLVTLLPNYKISG